MWLILGASSSRYRAEARENPLLLLEPGSRAVLEDVLIGFWLAGNRRLRMVQLPQDMWAGSFKQVGRLGRLLVAHQVLWGHLAWLTAEVDRLWVGAGSRVSSRIGCFGAMCAIGHCAHHEQCPRAQTSRDVLTRSGAVRRSTPTRPWPPGRAPCET